MKIRMLFLIALLITLTHPQPHPLLLSTPTKTTISSPQTYSLTLPSIKPTQHLFITTTTSLTSPDQIPHITLQLDTLTKNCFSAQNQLQGICILNNTDLNMLPQDGSKSNVIITVSCQQVCSFVIEAYLNDVFRMEIGNMYKISPKNDNTAIYQLEMSVPDEVFDQIKIQAQLTSSTDSHLSKGVQIYANVGNSGALFPNPSHYQYKAIPIHSGLGIDISKQQLPKGTWIKISIITNSKISISLTAQLSSSNTQQLTFGKKQHCLLSGKKQKRYVLDGIGLVSQMEDRDFNIIVVIYSGFPQIQVAFQEQFKRAIQNYGVGGNLNYLITPQIRSDYNFTGKIYIKTTSTTQSYFEINTSINPKKYLYITESITYLSFLKPLAIQNYVFDILYDLQKGESSETFFHFTLKLKVLEGGGYFANRICNQISIQSCLLETSQQFFGQAFTKQANELPGDILVYYSLYQIYQYAQLKQCRTILNNQNSTRYLCRIHMVGYNLNFLNTLQWGLTAFTRLKNIQLSQGVPFKDMVYEDAYNYYVFIIPKNIIEIEIFVTTLAGQSRLLTSQIYMFPQTLFAYLKENDIKTNANNVIKYGGQEVREKIYIGVYGRSAAEYVLNVIIKRKQEKSTQIVLIQKVQQFFHIDQKQKKTFKIVPSSQGQWTVQLIQLYGNLQTQLQISPSKIVCKSFLKCTFNATIYDQIFVIVTGNKISKFTLNYYLQESCRLFSLGVVNFIEVESKANQCIDFIISPNKSIQISYSQNLLNSFSTNLSISISINDNKLQAFQSHYKSLTKQQISIFCASNKTSHQKNACILKLNIIGDITQKSEIQLSVIDTESPQPLFDNMVLPYTRKSFKKSNPAYFYYYSLSQNSPTIFIKSLEYQSFFVVFKWIDYNTYLNNSLYQNIYPSYPQKADFKSSFQLTPYHRNLEIKIPPVDSKIQCSQCLLLISIFPVKQYKQSIFELEIISDEGSIQIGETVHGTLNKDEFYVYQLQKDEANRKGVITLKNYKENKSCYTANLLLQSFPQSIKYEGNQIFIQNTKLTHILSIKSYENNCKFQLVYWLIDVPIRIIQSGRPYFLSLTNSSSRYFIYYHQANRSFHLFESIISGYVQTYATPVNDSLQKTIQGNRFLFGSESIYDQIQIPLNNSNFCYNCYYLFKIVASPNAKGSIGIADSLTSQQLNTDEVVREKVLTNSIRLYEYYSFQPFKLRINIIYGQIQLVITDMKNISFFQGRIIGDRQIDLNPSIYTQFLAGYLFNLTIVKNSTYSLQIIDESKTRLIEGYPISYTFHPNQKASFSFNYAQENEYFNILLIADQYQSKQQNPMINLDLTTKTQSKQQQTVAIENHSHLGNIYSYDIKGKPADYNIKIKLNIKIKMKILISRNKLTYLQPSTSILSKNSTIYQIYTGGSPIMIQVFLCKGSAQLTASPLYSQIHQTQATNSISLSHSNIGGHYVIESRSFQHQFYALVKSRLVDQTPLYIISYSSIKILPYNYFDNIQRNVQYKVNHDYLEISFQIPAIISKRKNIRNITAGFSLIISDIGSDFNALIQCGMGNPLLTLSQNIPDFPPIQTTVFKYNISRQQLSQLSTQSTIKTFFMGVVMKISLLQQGNQIRKLTYIYQSIQVSLVFNSLINQGATSMKSFIIFWVIAPLIIGIGLAWFSLRYCLRRFRMMSLMNNQLMEEEDSNAPVMSQKCSEGMESKE